MSVGSLGGGEGKLVASGVSVLPEASVAAPRRGGLWRDTLRSVVHQRSSVIGLTLLGFFAFVALFATQLAPYQAITVGTNPPIVIEGPNRQFDDEGFPQRAGPCIHALGCSVEHTEHWFGLDGNYRDVLTRVIYGARISLVVGFATVGIAIIIGALLGAIAGFAGGRLDTLIMRLLDILLVFPALLLAISIVTVLGSSLFNALIAIALVAIPIYARIMRASVLAVRETDFVTASRALGEGSAGVLFRRVLPNALTPIIVAGTLGIATAVLDVAALSFIGLGADIRTPEWGGMIGREFANIYSAPHLLIFPGIALTLTVLGFNLLGDGVRDALDPRLNR